MAATAASTPAVAGMAAALATLGADQESPGSRPGSPQSKFRRVTDAESPPKRSPNHAATPTATPRQSTGNAEQNLLSAIVLPPFIDCAPPCSAPGASAMSHTTVGGKGSKMQCRRGASCCWQGSRSSFATNHPWWFEEDGKGRGADRLFLTPAQKKMHISLGNASSKLPPQT